MKFKTKIVSLVTIAIIGLLFLMCAEYCYIMRNIKPYIADSETVYIEVFGQIDCYDAEYID